MDDNYEMELSTTREEAATVVHGLADGIAAGAVQLGSGDEGRTVDVPKSVTLEIEFGAGDDELGLEVELEWQEDALEAERRADEDARDPTDEAAPDEVNAGGDIDGEETPAEETVDRPDDGPSLEEADGIAEPAVGAAARRVSLGRFELFEDAGGEWRWRLVHLNGNVIATSGEGYTRKHNARKGLRSVMRNAEGADVTERPD
jgi:amphi-Trp domain-containing protein